MTGEIDGGHPSRITVETDITESKRTVLLRFKSENFEIFTTTTDTPSIDVLMRQLAQARSEMLEPVPGDMPEGISHLSAYDPRWYVLPDTDNQFATLWIRHPAFGWSGYGFSRHEASNIAKWLRKVVPFTSTKSGQSGLSTSIGSDSYFASTEGLGFYYYGKGERRIGPNPFEQVEFDSDRAAGIVAGSITEKRLEQALRSRMRSDFPDVARNLFRPSGPLGPFSTKIDIGLLFRILSDDAYKDLTNLKNIRNDFAHHLELDSFEAQSISDRCKNFVLVDRHIGPVPPRPSVSLATERIENELPVRPSPYMGLPDYELKLRDPRFRYVMTAQILSFTLGLGSETAEVQLPLI